LKINTLYGFEAEVHVEMQSRFTCTL